MCYMLKTKIFNTTDYWKQRDTLQTKLQACRQLNKTYTNTMKQMITVHYKKPLLLYKKTLAHIKILLNCIVNVDPENDNIFYVEAN